MIATSRTCPPESYARVTRIGTVLRALLTGSWVYAGASGLWLLVLLYRRSAPDTWAVWIALPVQLAALVAATLSVRRASMTGVAVRLRWKVVVLLFVVVNLLGSLFWNTINPPDGPFQIGFGDALYFLDYLLMVVAALVVHAHLCGSTLDKRLALDIATVLVALLAVMWGVLVMHPTPADYLFPIALSVSIPYSLAAGTLLATMLVVHVRVPLTQQYAWVHLLAAAGIVEALWECAWLLGWAIDVRLVGASFNYGDVLAMVLVISSFAVSPDRIAPIPSADMVRRSSVNFLPTLAGLLALTVIAIAAAVTRSMESWVLVALLVLCAVLVSRYHYRAQRELLALNARLVRQHADERLTALVRVARDLILITDARGNITYASPAASSLVRVPAAALPGTPFTDLFGPSPKGELTSFLAALCREPGPEPIDLELIHAHPGEEPRAYRITGTNLLAHASVQGLSLIVSDISEQRALERRAHELLALERGNLAANMHDGFGQDLTAIAMLLQSASMNANAGGVEQRRALEEIIGRLKVTIKQAQALAMGLSPVETVKGSLGDLLNSIALSIGDSVDVTLRIDPCFQGRAVDGSAADHLCRIAKEAVRNALRHENCSEIIISLRAVDTDFRLTICDDARGVDSFNCAHESEG